MRADRLLTLVGLLRQHGRLSAAELARRLEVTRRTVMRDIEALSAAGVPVYAEQGRSGGYSLLPGYRPDAESLTPDEARALFVAGGGQIADALGLGPAFTQGLRKLATGLPDAEAGSVGHVLDRVVIDPGGWSGSVAEVDLLREVFDAVESDRRLWIDYRALASGHGGRRTVDPWGLVLAGPTWYLVAAHRGRPHTYRVSRIAELKVLDEPVRRPAKLDLRAVWGELRSSWQDQAGFEVVVKVPQRYLALTLRQVEFVARRPPVVEEVDGDDVLVRLEVGTLRGAAGVLLGMGDWVEVLSPVELRTEMATVASGVVRLYE